MVGRWNDALAIEPPARALSSVDLPTPVPPIRMMTSSGCSIWSALGLAVEIAGEAFEGSTLQHRERIAVLRVEPGAQAFLQLAQGGGEGAE